MTNFILNNPNFSKAKVQINGDRYELEVIKGNGILITVITDSVIRDQISFSRQDLKALYMLICTKSNCEAL